MFQVDDFAVVAALLQPGGEEGRFETGNPEFLSCTAKGLSCKLDSDCCYGISCRNERCGCVSDGDPCTSNAQCCQGSACVILMWGDTGPTCNGGPILQQIN